ncbi:type II toxin-antitoxin system PemK/MazF family toxin [bacterium]|nr:type II toxin-antitoxin system PemK/MazF family toxin [bacterium]
MADVPRQGDVWLVDFHEGWERPAVVVSRDELNRGRSLLVVPCTSSRVSERVRFANHVHLPQGTGGLAKDSVAQAHLVQPIRTSALLAHMGALDRERLAEVLFALAWVVDLFDS